MPTVEQVNELQKIRDTLLNWIENGIPEECIVFCMDETEFVDVSNITKHALLGYLGTYIGHVQQYKDEVVA